MNEYSLHQLTLDLVGVELPDVCVSLELLLGEREPLRVVRVVGPGYVLRHYPAVALQVVIQRCSFIYNNEFYFF